MPRGIYPRTKEQYRKIGLANAIKLKGRKLSMETKNKMSIAKRKRIKELGYMNSPETRKKISDIWKKKWARGEVTDRQKMNIVGKGINTQFKNGHIVPKKWREAVKKSRAKQKFPMKDSSIEVKIQDFLTTLRIEFVTHKYINIKNSYQCDIFIPIQKGILKEMIIECDGDFIHCNPIKYPPNYIRFPNASDNKTAKEIWEIDHKRTKQLIKKGFRVLRIWGSEIKVMNLNDFKNKLNKYKNDM